MRITSPEVAVECSSISKSTVSLGINTHGVKNVDEVGDKNGSESDVGAGSGFSSDSGIGSNSNLDGTRSSSSRASSLFSESFRVKVVKKGQKKRRRDGGEDANENDAGARTHTKKRLRQQQVCSSDSKEKEECCWRFEPASVPAPWLPSAIDDHRVSERLRGPIVHEVRSVQYVCVTLQVAVCVCCQVHTQ